jgi:hypothetical protein
MYETVTQNSNGTLIRHHCYVDAWDRLRASKISLKAVMRRTGATKGWLVGLKSRKVWAATPGWPEVTGDERQAVLDHVFPS